MKSDNCHSYEDQSKSEFKIVAKVGKKRSKETMNDDDTFTRSIPEPNL
jgi:hypothetical protein